MKAVEAAIEQIQRIISERMSDERSDLHLPEIRALAQALDVLTTATNAPQAPLGPDESFPLVEGFLIHLQNLGRSPRTISQHRRELELWSVWLMLQGVPIRVATPDLAGRYLMEREIYNGGNPAAMRRTVASLQALYSWAEATGHLMPGHNPVKDLRGSFLLVDAVH